MKKLILLLLIGFSFSIAQDTTYSVKMTSYYRDTLTTSIDTLDFVFDDALKTDKITVWALSSAADTVEVYSQTLDGVSWSKQAVLDLSSNATAVNIFATTTAREVMLLDPKPKKIRLVSLSNDGSTCQVVVQAKRSSPIEGR